MDDEKYAKNAATKIKTYIENGIIPTIDLITTYETKNCPLDYESVEKVIKEYFLGIYLVPIISEKIDNLLVGSHENFYILLHICSLGGGIILGNLIYYKYMKKVTSELEEVIITQKEIEDYIRKGKTQFLLQVLIIVGLFVVSVFEDVNITCIDFMA